MKKLVFSDWLVRDPKAIQTAKICHFFSLASRISSEKEIDYSGYYCAIRWDWVYRIRRVFSKAYHERICADQDRDHARMLKKDFEPYDEEKLPNRETYEKLWSILLGKTEANADMEVDVDLKEDQER